MGGAPPWVRGGLWNLVTANDGREVLGGRSAHRPQSGASLRFCAHARVPAFAPGASGAAGPLPRRAATTMPPTDAELRELEELKAMIHGTPVRESAIPLGAVSRFLVGEDNRKAADEARREKEERDRIKAELAAKRTAHGDKLREDARQRRAR